MSLGNSIKNSSKAVWFWLIITAFVVALAIALGIFDSKKPPADNRPSATGTSYVADRI